MNRRLTAIVQREGDGYVALCPEVDVASQGDTGAEARDNLAEALTLFFETASTDEIDKRLRDEVYVTHVEVAVGGHEPTRALMRRAEKPPSVTRCSRSTTSKTWRVPSSASATGSSGWSNADWRYGSRRSD